MILNRCLNCLPLGTGRGMLVASFRTIFSASLCIWADIALWVNVSNFLNSYHKHKCLSWKIKTVYPLHCKRKLQNIILDCSSSEFEPWMLSWVKIHCLQLLLSDPPQGCTIVLGCNRCLSKFFFFKQYLTFKNYIQIRYCAWAFSTYYTIVCLWGQRRQRNKTSDFV